MLRSFVGGLGGKELSEAEFDHVLGVLEAAEPGTVPVEPELLMREDEWSEVRGRLAVAGKLNSGEDRPA